ncbi:hypothetical protein N9A29_04445 [Candidatus Pelagibacter ubique]|nr:hypothetical protein [Candidatus Pelagibacter ubique]
MKIDKLNLDGKKDSIEVLDKIFSAKINKRLVDNVLYKKKEGEVIEIDRPNNRAKVQGINIVKKHVKTTKEKKGGIVSKESFIHISNLKLIDEKAKTKKTEAKK